MSECCETGKTPPGKANATDKFNSIARHNQHWSLFENAATTDQAIFGPFFNSLLEAIEVALINSEDEILTARKDAFRIMRQDLDSFLGQPEVVHAA